MPLVRKSTAAVDAPPADVEELKTALASSRPDERWQAARALIDMPGGIALLGAGLATEADIRVREVIFSGIARTATPEGAALLLQLLRSEDASLRSGALDALAAMPADMLAGRLPELLYDEDPDVRLLACELARGMPSEDATQLMADLLERESEPNVCAATMDVLAEIGGPQALPVLQRSAERFASSPFLAFAIEIAVKRIKTTLDSGR
ncbi:HEAT repeat protein [Ancylobacter aquaticus]|uniref:HEAT repeat protein n=1 Tax=Ancylobacter aquaticus TaxID=100 RepID=A0A4R1HH66_ANCAQ|nr:HEAT repeat domain-containing protein [Ancylobacter aquaticus]TCK19775.1 HEAT repeat protein [Ancylobacter aquaticus]